ncbi:Ppx/GppA phosphatase family protein [Gallaecimonas mangrovi]|uniref:Ppx/GppA phosphatase family protein n=1 Tax=Gallaecimonas mangrovi TaxID=2291597 RepID=UPI000E20C21E
MRKTSPLFAAIDLGSNSFHMLVVRALYGQVQILAKVKRKVRLAAGLDDDYQLSTDAMERGWECLSLFAERLEGIPTEQVRVVATATLRFAKNAEQFLEKGQQILGRPIEVISGEEEAALIYQGVAHTAGQSGRRLVVDIGGASTELIIGTDFTPEQLKSLEMGCVTFQQRYFKGGNLGQAQFDQAIDAAKARLAPLKDDYLKRGWSHCVGASGSVQAVQEVQLARGEDESVTLARLRQTLNATIACGSLDKLVMPGLGEERKPVFAAGLAILIAIFESLDVKDMQASGGALREGVLYGLLPQAEKDVRSRTLAAIVSRFSVDDEQGQRVAQLVGLLGQAQLNDKTLSLTMAAARLHELGLAIGFKQACGHGDYLIRHLDLPGFCDSDKAVIADLVNHQQGALTATQPNLPALMILRLAILLCGHRGALPDGISLGVNGHKFSLELPSQWLAAKKLLATQLEEEASNYQTIGWDLQFL